MSDSEYVCCKNVGFCLQSASRYFDFTKNIHAKLPREVRDSIYAYVINYDTEFEIAHCARLSHFRYPESGFYCNKCKEPCFLNPSLTYKSIIKEIVEAFYCAYWWFKVRHPGELDSFLREDFFGVGVALKDSVLSKLTINGSLDRYLDGSIDPAELRNQFALILSGEQRLSRSFHLRICFETVIDRRYSDRSLVRLSEVLTEVLNELKPVFETVQAEPRKGNVDIEICFGEKPGPQNWDAYLGAECAYFSKMQWMQTIKKGFGLEQRLVDSDGE